MRRLSASLFVLCLTIGGLVRADDWPHFLGLNHDFHSAETGLEKNLPPSGPPVIWEMKRGDGHAGPVILGEHLVLIHQRDRQEIVECRNAATGKPIWEHAYPVDIGQNYGISDAPRSSPVIDPATRMVFTLGNDGDLIGFDLATGEIAWQTKLDEKFGEASVFF
ncbi:MAG: PQQ-like beta-propeller repeat protein, partial [Verrucomicrobiae bacterium]|nr:PQQ-like beta-propeller repeat protein [Verrucomicrobiae bacterium]